MFVLFTRLLSPPWSLWYSWAGLKLTAAPYCDLSLEKMSAHVIHWRWAPTDMSQCQYFLTLSGNLWPETEQRSAEMKRSRNIFGKSVTPNLTSHTLTQYTIYTCIGRQPDDPYCSCKNCIMNQPVVLIHSKQRQEIFVYSDVWTYLQCSAKQHFLAKLRSINHSKTLWLM